MIAIGFVLVFKAQLSGAKFYEVVYQAGKTLHFANSPNQCSGNISHDENVHKRELNWIDKSSIELSPCKTEKQTTKTQNKQNRQKTKNIDTAKENKSEITKAQKFHTVICEPEQQRLIAGFWIVFGF